MRQLILVLLLVSSQGFFLLIGSLLIVFYLLISFWSFLSRFTMFLLSLLTLCHQPCMMYAFLGNLYISLGDLPSKFDALHLAVMHGEISKTMTICNVSTNLLHNIIYCRNLSLIMRLQFHFPLRGSLQKTIGNSTFNIIDSYGVSRIVSTIYGLDILSDPDISLIFNEDNLIIFIVCGSPDLLMPEDDLSQRLVPPYCLGLA